MHNSLKIMLILLIFVGLGAAQPKRKMWHDDLAWPQGNTEWALHDAVRGIYCEPRRL